MRALTISSSSILLAALLVGCADYRSPTDSTDDIPQVSRTVAAGLASGLVVASITPIVDGTVRDGLHSPKDGAPDAILENTLVQILDVDRPSLPFEDRGVIEFDISSLSPPISKAELILSVFRAEGPFPFTIDVFTYSADGSLSLNDFNAGSFFTSFEYSGEATVTLDVTPFIGVLAVSGGAFAGFNFQFSVPTTIERNGPFVAFNSLESGPPASLNITAEPSRVEIDIKPGSDPNSVNCNNEKQTIAVAILTTDDFDATTVDHTTVTFEGASETHVDKKTGVARRHEEDVDGDGDTDLVLHFRLGATDLDCDSTDGTLTGETFDGQAIEGTDAVRMINRGGGQP